MKTFSILVFTSLLAIQVYSAGAIAAVPLKTEDRLSAVNRALEQSLKEQAKSQRDFEKTALMIRRRESVQMRKQNNEERANERTDDRLVVRGDSKLDMNSRETRAQSRDDRESDRRDRREESRREHRLNWLKD